MRVKSCVKADTEGESCDQYCLNKADGHQCACYPEFYLELDGRTCKSKLGTKGSNGTQVQLESKPNKFLTKVVMITIVCSTVCLGMI